MTSLYAIKEAAVLDTPVLLFDFTLRNGSQLRWSTHPVVYDGHAYSARVMRHDAFEMRLAADGISEAGGRVTITLANADGFFAPMEVAAAWKGGDLKVRFVFFDLSGGAATSDSRVLFRGTCGGLDHVTESSVRLSFHNRLAIQRVTLPSVRVQSLCPWQFPADGMQRQIAVDGGAQGSYSPLHACGYSPDIAGGVGNVGSTGPFAFCDRTRRSCEERGMFSADSNGRTTARFGGCDARETTLGASATGGIGGHELIPVVYGTCWIDPPIVFSSQSGGLQHYQVLLGLGPIQGPLKVLANRFDIPEFHSNLVVESTGWYRVVSSGSRVGAFDPDLQQPDTSPATGPYGSVAYLHLALPASIQSGRSLPRVEVLVDGMLLPRYDLDGSSLGTAFTKNPAWVLLDILKRIGWQESEIDIAGFSQMAAFCDSLIETSTTSGEAVSIPRYRCNVALEKQRSVSEIMRGIHLATGLYVRYLHDGKLTLACEHSLAVQSPTPPAGSNCVDPISGGWAAYEFGDGTYGFSGIARKDNDEPSLSLWSRSGADTPNKASLEFADEFNQYQRDSLSIGDSDDILAVGQEIPVQSKALGVPNFSQAYRALSRQLLKSTRGNLYVEFDTSVKGIALSPGDIITITYLHNGFDRTPFRIIRIAPGLNCALIHVVAQLHDDSWYIEPGTSLPLGSAQTTTNDGSPRPVLGPLLSPDGSTAFSINEYSATEFDGSGSTLLRLDFLRPPRTAVGALPAPRLSVQASVHAEGGVLPADENLYYAVSAVGANGDETKLSPLVKARLGGGTNTYRVVLTDLIFPPTAAAFHVYRGQNPHQLLRIASSVPLSSTFQDSGLVLQTSLPPDDLFDHANFYWRFEWLPPIEATTFSASTIGSNLLSLITNECAGKVLRIVSGKGQGQERAILSNTATTITASPRFLVVPDSTSAFSIAEASWHFGASSATGVVEFEVPNRPGSSIQIIGRAASVSERESEIGLSPLGRWTLDGAAGQTLDTAPPPIPSFGLSYSGRGSVDLVGVGFATLLNTHSVSSGEITLHYWNELANPCPYALAAPLSPESNLLDCTPALPVSPGGLIQVNAEVMVVTQVLNAGSQVEVARSAFGTAIASHPQGATVYPLARHTSIAPFSAGFFGSPASGSYRYSIYLPNARIAAAELAMTNSRGVSPTKQQSFTMSTDGGLRLLTGGQYTIMVPGYLSLQTAAAPPLVIEESRAVKDVYAVIAEAPTGAPVNLLLRQGGVPYAALTIPQGATMSGVVSGANLPPLTSQSILTLDITGVPASGLDTPGRDLTIIVRV